MDFVLQLLLRKRNMPATKLCLLKPKGRHSSRRHLKVLGASLLFFCVLCQKSAIAQQSPNQSQPPSDFTAKNTQSSGSALSGAAPSGPAADRPAMPFTNGPQAPALPERGRPPLPAVHTGLTTPATQAKPSLAWRQKAMKLSQEKYRNGAQSDNSNNQLIRFYSANYSDTLMALAGSCAAAGFHVELINSNAGEVLASSADMQLRLVFTLWEQPEGKTWVSAGIDRGSAIPGAKSAALILDTTGNTVSKRGRI